MNAKQLVAANIKLARKDIGLTQSEAAERIGVTQPTWQTYESGKVSIGIEVLAEIARALETSMSALVNTEIQSSRAESKNAQAKRRRAA